MIFWAALVGVEKEEEVKVVLQNLYNEMSVAYMAEYFGVSMTAIRRALKNYGVQLRPRGGKHVYEEKGGKP